MILIGCAAFLAWTSHREDLSRQHQNIEVAKAVVIGSVLLGLWFLFVVGRRPVVRWGAVGCLSAIVVLVVSAVRITGVTGDLVPIVEWRWKRSGLDEIQTTPWVDTVETGTVRSRLNYTQFLGPDRTGTVDGLILNRDWSRHPPELLWRKAVGAAWSGFAILGDNAVTQEQRGEEEMVICYELGSGTVRWTHSDSAHYSTIIAGEGPRATPTIVSNRVFTLGATGILNCLDSFSGRKLWARNVVEENDGKVNDWGMSCSPLVIENRVIVSAGGSEGRALVAYDVDTGEFLWGGGDGGAGYSSPQTAVFWNLKQVLMFNDKAVTSHNLDSGSVVWEYPWTTGHPHVAIPLVLPDNRILVSSGYGGGSELLSIEKEGRLGSRTFVEIYPT